MRWELYCRVIDNHGDLGVCWRLARQLGERGDTVRLWVDDPRALEWMAPRGATGVQVQRWREGAVTDLGDVVVEAFGCELPAAVRLDMSARAGRGDPVVWIDLEYLSAEPYVERSHGLPSPQVDGLTRWFFFPGFGARTGGLLRDPPATAQPNAREWLAAQGWRARDGERVVSLFCYAHARPEAWLPAFAARPTLLLTAPGAATDRLGACALPPTLRHQALPWLPQTVYDRLLQCCDLNAVRGEDSFAQAHHAGAPLLWHIYPQHDGAHVAKLDAWLDRLLDGTDAEAAAAVRATQHAWNGLGGAPVLPPDLAAWQAAHGRLRSTLHAQPDLATALRSFAQAHRAKP